MNFIVKNFVAKLFWQEFLSSFRQDGFDDSSSTQKEQSLLDTTPTQEISSIPLGDNCLAVDISDALSEKDKVKFTVHTRTSLPGYAKSDFLVVRQHEEFVWLHDRFEENDEYGGYIVNFLNLRYYVRFTWLYRFRFRRAHHVQTSMRQEKNYNVWVKVKETWQKKNSKKWNKNSKRKIFFLISLLRLVILSG